MFLPIKGSPVKWVKSCKSQKIHHTIDGLDVQLFGFQAEIQTVPVISIYSSLI